MPTRIRGGTRDQMENSGPACTQVLGKPCTVKSVTGGQPIGRRRLQGLDTEWVVTYRITVAGGEDASAVRDAIRREQSDIARILGEVISEDAGTEIQVLKLEATSDESTSGNSTSEDSTATLKIGVVIVLILATLIGGVGLGFFLNRNCTKSAPVEETVTTGAVEIEIPTTDTGREWISPRGTCRSPGAATRNGSSIV